MKVLALMTDSYGGHGGIAQYNRDLLDALNEAAIISSVVSLPRVPADRSLPLPAKLQEQSAVRGTLRYVYQAMRLALRHRPALILCGHLNLLPVAAMLKRLTGAPLLLELYGIEAWSPRRSRVMEWAVRQVDLAISISRFTRRKFLTWSGIDPQAVRLMPNAIHLSEYRPGPYPLALAERYAVQGKKLLLTLGRLASDERYKGHDRIIALIPELLTRLPDLVYLIAGDGDDRPRLESLARQHGVAGQVRFLGRIPVADMADLYNLADAFAMPSSGEGFGFVFLEAAACGLPVLGGNVDGSPDALADGQIGMMVDPLDPQALCQSLFELMNRPKSIPADLARYDIRSFTAQIGAIAAHLLVPSASVQQTRKIA